jgi:hypothetical protein
MFKLLRKLFYSDFYWHNKDLYFKFLNCPNSEKTEHWQLEDELAEHKIYIVRGDYGIMADMAVLQIKDENLMKNPQQTIAMVVEIFRRHKYEAICVGNERPESIWGKRQW